MSEVIEVDAITMLDDPSVQELPEVRLINVGAEVAKFDPVNMALSVLVADITKTTYDIGTTAGKDTARALRARCVKIRTDGDKTYKTLNTPMLEVQRKWRDLNTSIATTIAPHEAKLDAEIKAFEAAAEAEKQRKIQAERDRVAGLRAKITAITTLLADAAKATSVRDMQTLQATLAALILDEATYGEFLEEAAHLYAEVTTQLEGMLAAAYYREAESDRLAQEALALAAQREEQALTVRRANAILAIRSYPLVAVGQRSAEIQEHIEALQAPVTADFGGQHDEAVVAYKDALAWLGGILDAALASEQAAAAARQAREQEDLRRQADEALAQRRQDEAAAATKLLKQQTDAFEAEQVEARARLAEEGLRIKAERAELERRGQELAAASAPPAEVVAEEPAASPQASIEITTIDEAPVAGTGPALPPEVTLTPHDIAKGRAARMVKLLMDDANCGTYYTGCEEPYITELDAINDLVDAGVQWALTERKLELENKSEEIPL